MPYYKLTSFIEHKAAWNGIPVILTNENHSSRLATYAEKGSRSYQGPFICQNCGHRYNADYNRL